MVDMENVRAVVSFVGMRDPYPENEEEPGPLLALLLAAAKNQQPYDEAWLLCTGGTFLERARDLEREAQGEGLRLKLYPIDFPVKDVIDYAEIWALLGRALQGIQERSGTVPRTWDFLLDSGTPQMKTSLFLAARAGLFRARLIQGIPARFAGGTYKSREVRFEGLPSITIEDLERRGGTVQSRLGSSYSGASRAIGSLEAPVATSPSFAEAIRMAIAVARYDDPVLILGETGTGKTMIARRIHGESHRKTGPFVEVNCSAIPEALAESELFGHARGAFSGADKARSGKFRAAHGGTLFLDEIGDLSLEVQAKLLKAIEDKEVTPVGLDEPVKADARLIAATNRDIPELIRLGRFRRDLYERIKVVVVRLSPLRERREDIRPLAERFLSLWNAQYNERRFLTDDAMSLLEAYSWPGNVRELQNALRSASCSSTSEALGPEALPDELGRFRDGAALGGNGTERSRRVDFPDDGLNLKARLLQVEWDYVTQALRKADGNREAAARLLGMTGHAFRKALRERLAAFADEGWEEGM